MATPLSLERVATVPCPRCHALPGEACRLRIGDGRTMASQVAPHSERVALVDHDPGESDGRAP